MTLMAHPATEADRAFDSLAHLPGLWRFDRIERDHARGFWEVWASHPVGRGVSNGVSGMGATITLAIAALHRQMDRWDRENR